MSWLAQYPRVQVAASNYAKGRQGYQDVWFVIHSTDTNYQDNYPANLGKYWAGTNTQVSVHFCVSDTMTYQFVSMDDTAYQARNPGNLRAVGVEIVGKADWSRNEWLAHIPMIRRAAKLCAEVTLARGYRTSAALLTPASLRARSSGLTCHKDLSATFAGTHTDPGPNFPWDVLFAELRKNLAAIADEQARVAVTKTVPVEDPEGDLMAVTDADFDALVAKVNRLVEQNNRTDAVLSGGGQGWNDSNLATQLGYVVKKISELGAKVDALAKPTS